MERERGRRKKESKRAHIHNKIKFHNCWVHDTKWRTLIPQKSTHWSEGSEPHVRLPNLGVWQQEEEFPENQTLKASEI